MGLFSPLPPAPASAIDSRQAAWRLFITLLLMTFGSSGMYVSSVVMPQVQADFDISRAAASLPYTLMMLGFGVGGMLMGHLSDRRGIAFSLAIGAAGVGSGYILAGLTHQAWLFMVINGLLLGFLGISATFAPLVADTSLWWNRRRGIAVAICASGNYLAGALWPSVAQYGVDSIGWRSTYLLLGVTSVIFMALLALQMRQRQFTAMGMFAWVSSPENVPRSTLRSDEIPTAANNWAGQNYTGYCNPEMDKLIDDTGIELDRDKRRAMWQRIQEIYATDLPVLPLYYRADPYVVPKWLTGIEPTGHQYPSTLWIENWRSTQ